MGSQVYLRGLEHSGRYGVTSRPSDSGLARCLLGCYTVIVPGVLGTLALSVSGVTALPPGFGGLTDTGSGVDGGGLLDGETVLDQLAHILAGVGVADLGDLVGVQPNLGV